MGSTGRDRLTGRVEVDEAFYGGLTPGHRGRSQVGKTLVAAAVERRGRGSGRIRMQVLPTASSAHLGEFLTKTVTPGSTVITDGWRSYVKATATADVQHEPHIVSTSDDEAHVVLPGVHRVFSLSKRMFDATYQGGVSVGHFQAYLDEYVFRFNRRHASERGLLFLRLLEHAITANPAPYHDLIIGRTGPQNRPRPAFGIRPLPASPTGDPLDRPWRRAA